MALPLPFASEPLRPASELGADLAADPADGGAGLPRLADAQDDAADQAAADQAVVVRARSAGTTSPAARRPRTSCARSSSSCARPSASSASARRCRRASCCTARPAPARRCSRRRSRTSRAPTSSASRRAPSSRCSPASARRASGVCSTIAKKNAPAIIFIDELDAVGLKRGFDISREKDQTLNQLLVEMDGFEDSGDLVVIAASNRVDGARPGAAAARAASTARCSSRRPTSTAASRSSRSTRAASRSATSTSSMVARQTSGLTGADLANLCNEAAIFAGRAEARLHHGGGLRRRARARRRRPSDAPRDHAGREEGDRLPRGRPRARLASCCPRSTKVHKISIIPRGRALGYTLNLPEEDRYLKSKEELLDYLKVLFGGRDGGGDRVRPRHHRRRRRPAPGHRDQPRDDRGVRHGQAADRARRRRPSSDALSEATRAQAGRASSRR